MKHIEKIEKELIDILKEKTVFVETDNECSITGLIYKDKLKQSLRQSHTSFIQNLIQRVEGERKDNKENKGITEYCKVWDSALDTIIKMLKEEII
jgi:hypothetical protein